MFRVSSAHLQEDIVVYYINYQLDALTIIYS